MSAIERIRQAIRRLYPQHRTDYKVVLQQGDEPHDIKLKVNGFDLTAVTRRVTVEADGVVPVVTVEMIPANLEVRLDDPALQFVQEKLEEGRAGITVQAEDSVWHGFLEDAGLS
jgi:hypothetical protein